MVHTVDRQDGLLECTRFRMFEGYVTAQPIEKRALSDGIRELVNGPEFMAGKILPLIVGFAAHVWIGNGFAKLGSYESENDAFEAIIDRFAFADSRNHIQRSA